MPRGRPRRDAGTAAGATPLRRRGSGKPQVPFARKLVLNQWILSLFGVEKFEDLAEHLRGEALEGLDANNVHHFHHALTAQLFNLTWLSTERLLEYDQNIVSHTLALNARRLTHGERPIVWKYFQYLALLFTEVYLDRWFSDRAGLHAALDAQIAAYNDGKPEGDQLAPLDADDPLNKLAFWMATGSGKTFVMHANIRQYRHYLERAGRKRELNRIILLTPNEGLSQQHLREFEAAGIDAEIFDKDGRGLYAGKWVEILEITKLREGMGDKTVAVEAFEGNNLVLVDEGHRGTSGGGDGAWMKNRNALCESGFSFEYSATFGQAVKGDKPLIETYARCTLFDYSYRYFYGDGFGKDYQILNLDEGTQRDHLDLYLTACLLSFFQQQRLHREREGAFKPFLIAKPLWIFVGGSVTATLAKRDATDIVEILQFLARYVADKTKSITLIERVLNHGLVTNTGANLFAGRFAYLISAGLASSQVFDETLATLFNAPAGGRLYVQNLKGASGEIALRLGADNEAFGIINVGKDSALVKLCEETGLDTGDLEFAGSMFHAINEPSSTINLLIGSKKFTEGWSSWRVSTMGLMNVGKGEGAQIIQLFGRGVRLKGFGMSLKRSARAELPAGVARPKHIEVLETLGIFGIHADYMAQFREFLEEEGVPKNDERLEIVLPIIHGLGTQRLKTVRLKQSINGVSTEFGTAFRRLGPIPTVKPPETADRIEHKNLQLNPVVLNWYPKIQALAPGLKAGAKAAPNETHFTVRHVAFLDVDALYFELERFKAERSWHNLNLTRDGIEDLLRDASWYQLLIPESEMEFGSFERVRRWQEIALALLKKYTDRYYTFRKREWEMPHLEYRDLESDDPNFPRVEDAPDEPYGYRILIDRSREEVVAKLEELKAAIASGKLEPWSFHGLKAICFGHHLYQPLLALDGNVVEIKPAPLNKGERIFVEDLATFHDEHADFFKGKQLYLLRNLSRGKGVGFFEAGNFHPDFILWLIADGRQHVLFVDPKGVRNLPLGDPKIAFHKTIKDIEERLGDSSVRLEAFIVSNTPSMAMKMVWGIEKAEMLARHVVFQEEDKHEYVRTMLASALKRQ